MDVNRKKKIGLLTLKARSYNYGGCLVSFALQNVISSLGYDCEIIDYQEETEANIFSLSRSWSNLTWDKLEAKAKGFLKRAKGNAFKNSEPQLEQFQEMFKKRKACFEAFRQAHMQLSATCSYPQLEEATKSYDGLVCGSDQIWNPDYCLPSFFLNFAHSSQRPFVYAASIGKSHLQRRQLKTYGEMLTNLNRISVREYSAKTLLESYSPKEISVVLDPTLLVDVYTWQEIARSHSLALEPYLFCYFLENNKEKMDAGKKLAATYGLKLITIPYGKGSYQKEEAEIGQGKNIDFPIGPGEFLNLILKADYVLTDSFHASVFSILFEKEFRVFGRNSGSYNMNTRLDTLLSYFSLENCLIPNACDLEPASWQTITKEDVRYRERKEYSYAFLKEALGE